MHKIKIRFDESKHIRCEKCNGGKRYYSPRCEECNGKGFRWKTWTEMITLV